MTISRRGGASLEVNNGPGGNLAWGSGVVATDLAVVTCCWWENNADVDANAPTGFTERASVILSGTGSAERRAKIWTKACDGTETGNLAVSTSANTYQGWTLDIMQGSTGDLTFTSVSAPDTGNSSNATAPSVSGTNGQGLLAIYALDDPPSTINSAPSGMTSGSSSFATTLGVEVFWQALTATEATGVKTWDFSATRVWNGFSMLVNEAAGGGGVVNARNGIALSGISAINGITKSTLSHINGLTI